MRSKVFLFTLLLTPFALFQAPSPISKPLTRVDVLALVAGAVPSERVAKYVEKRGITFQPGDEYFDILKATGAEEPVFAALRKAQAAATDSGGTPAGVKHPEPSGPSPEMAAKESAILEHLVRGIELKQRRSYPDALEASRAASQLDPENPFLRYYLSTFPSQPDREPVSRELREAIRLDPEFAEAHLALAQVLRTKSDPAAATAEYREALRLAPESVPAHLLFGCSLEKAGDLDGAISQYLLAARLKPGLPEPHRALGRMLEMKGDRDAALSQFRLASELPSSSPVSTSCEPKRIRVGGQVESAKLILQPKPDYPLSAKMKRIQGTVKLEAVISKDGTIQDLMVLAGHPLLVKAAVEAVSRWRYQKTLLNGEPVEVVTEIDVNFTLSER